MNADMPPRPPPDVPPAQPDDLLAEGARVRKLSTSVDGVKSLTQGLRIVNDWILAEVLFALWDSGFYEFSLSHPAFLVAEAAEELRLDPTILRWLTDYLVGRGILHSGDGRLGLTEHGARLSNILLRGTMDLYIGGWGPQLASIGPLLRGGMTQDDFRDLRSASHTVRGTEELFGIRTVPTILRALDRRKLRGVLHLACRTGELLVELARSEPTLRGMGIDKAGERIEAARAKALRHGVDSRLRFATAEVGLDPLPIEPELLEKLDAVVALFLFHEVYRHGRQAVVDLLRKIRAALPGRHLLMMETVPAEVAPPGKKPPETFSQLDYLLIHRLRDQGLPLPSAEWKSLLEEAGLKLLDVQDIYWSALYLAEL